MGSTPLRCCEVPGMGSTLLRCAALRLFLGPSEKEGSRPSDESGQLNSMHCDIA